MAQEFGDPHQKISRRLSGSPPGQEPLWCSTLQGLSCFWLDAVFVFGSFLVCGFCALDLTLFNGAMEERCPSPSPQLGRFCRQLARAVAGGSGSSRERTRAPA